MIFEEYEANNVSDDLFHASEPNNSEPTGISRSNEIALTETSLPKKRIAHENATKSHSTSLPAFKQSQNHVQNAMQVRYFYFLERYFNSTIYAHSARFHC